LIFDSVEYFVDQELKRGEAFHQSVTAGRGLGAFSSCKQDAPDVCLERGWELHEEL